MPTAANWEMVREQGRAIGHPTRFQLFMFLRDAHRPVGVAELSQHFDLNHNGVRQHLFVLRDAGLVLEETAAPNGPGRPALQYRVRPGAVERWEDRSPHAVAAGMLLELVTTGETPREVGRRTGQALIAERAGQAARESSGESTDPVEVLNDFALRQGFEPRLQTDADGVRVNLHRCPFLEISRNSPEVLCQLHLGMAEGLAEGSDYSVDLSIGLVDSERPCCFSLSAGTVSG